MADFAETMGKLDALEASFDGVAGDVDVLKVEIRALKDQVGAGGMTADQEAEVVARIDTLQAKIAAKDAETPGGEPTP